MRAASLATGSSAASRHPAVTCGATDSPPSRPAAQAQSPPTSRRRCRRRGSRTLALPVTAAGFGLQPNFNPLDFLKVPSGQAQITLSPWLEGHERRERMRRWLQWQVGVCVHARGVDCSCGLWQVQYARPVPGAGCRPRTPIQTA